MLKYLIDGYNFLFCFPDLFDDDREALIEDLNHKCSETSCNISVIFDSYNTDSLWSRKKKLGKMKIIFTQQGESADEYIISHLRKVNGKTYCVVTEDRGLSLECQSLEATIISPAEFLTRVRKKKKKGSSLPEKPSKYEVERYLNQFGEKKKEVIKVFKGFDNPDLDRLWKIFNHLTDEQKG